MVSARRAKASIPPHLSFCTLPTFVDDLDVVVEDGSDDGHHVGFDDPCPDVLGASDADVEDALECQVPFPHVHHVLAPALFEDAYQSLDTAIDGQNVSYPGRGSCEVCKMVERIDQREG